jgi:hypothetical protein
MARINGALKAGTLAASVLAVASVAAAQGPSPVNRASALKALTDCRAVAESAARLACFDAAAARLDQAEQAGDVVVLDRAQVRTAKREAFGFSLPSFNLFDRSEVQRSVEVNSLEAKVASATKAGGPWIVTLDNGQVWRQTDAKQLYRIRPGDAVLIRRGAIGSFLLKVGDSAAFKAERSR